MSSRRPAEPTRRSAGRRRSRKSREQRKLRQLARRRARLRRHLRLFGLFLTLAGLEAGGLWLWNGSPVRRWLQPEPAIETTASAFSPPTASPARRMPDPFGAIASPSTSAQSGATVTVSPGPSPTTDWPKRIEGSATGADGTAFQITRRDLERQLGPADRPATDHRFRYSRLGLSLETAGNGPSRTLASLKWERPAGKTSTRALEKLASLGILTLPATALAGPARQALEDMALSRPAARILVEDGGKRLWVLDRERQMVLSFDTRGLASLLTGKPTELLTRQLETRLLASPTATPAPWAGVFSADWFAGRPLVSTDFVRTRRVGPTVLIDLRLRVPVWNPDSLVTIIHRESMQERAASSPGVRITIRDPQGSLVVEGDWFPEGSPESRVGTPDVADGVAIRWN
ncbi:MAG: hypothetical protein VKP72_04985 [bacterium]|nr:hypothetical protein [bacterium]